MMGLSTTLSISFGCALVAGKNRVPSPAAGKTALRTLRPAALFPWVVSAIPAPRAIYFFFADFFSFESLEPVSFASGPLLGVSVANAAGLSASPGVVLFA